MIQLVSKKSPLKVGDRSLQDFLARTGCPICLGRHLSFLEIPVKGKEPPDTGYNRVPVPKHLGV